MFQPHSAAAQTTICAANRMCCACCRKRSWKTQWRTRQARWRTGLHGRLSINDAGLCGWIGDFALCASPRRRVDCRCRPGGADDPRDDEGSRRQGGATAEPEAQSLKSSRGHEFRGATGVTAQKSKEKSCSTVKIGRRYERYRKCAAGNVCLPNFYNVMIGQMIAKSDKVFLLDHAPCFRFAFMRYCRE